MSDNRTDLSMDDIAPVHRPTENDKIAARWNELRLAGKHGVFETLFQIAKEQRRAAHIAALKEAEAIVRAKADPLDEWPETVALYAAADAISARISILEKGTE